MLAAMANSVVVCCMLMVLGLLDDIVEGLLGYFLIRVFSNKMNYRSMNIFVMRILKVLISLLKSFKFF